MALTISCRDLGTPCDHTVTGDSFESITARMREHAIAAHGQTSEALDTPEMQTIFKAALRQASRPPHLRTTRIDLPL